MQTDPKQPEALCNGVHPVQPRILVVDDEPAILFAYQKLITAEGFTVDACDGLNEALSLINKHSYIAVITDIRLSGSENTEGVDLLRAIRLQQPSSKTIVVTGFGNSCLEQTLTELGATYYFEKPVKPSKILEIIYALKDGCAMIGATCTLWMALAIVATIALAPASAHADGCNLKEFADHIEVVCIGPQRNTPASSPEQSAVPQVTPAISSPSNSNKSVPQQAAIQTDVAPNGAQVSKKRQHIEEIRSLNAHRFDAITAEPPMDGAGKQLGIKGHL